MAEMKASSTNWPREIDPIKFADRGAKLEGEIALVDLKRLHNVLANHDGQIQFELQFNKDAEGLRVITGQVKAELALICQRCNQPMGHAIDLKMNLSPIVSDKQAAQLPKSYDPLVTNGEPVMLISILEEEILLNLPMVPKHPMENCPTAQNL